MWASSQDDLAKAGGFQTYLWRSPVHTVDFDEIPCTKKPWNDYMLAVANTNHFPMVSKWCEMEFVHPQWSDVLGSM